MAASLDTSCDIYTCAVCLENMIDRSPRMLSCHHTFCLRCLQTLPIIGSKIECPTCRQDTILDNEDTEKLPVNFMLIQMREHMLKLLTNKESVCHFCKTSVTNQKCRDLLCSSCVDTAHNWIKNRMPNMQTGYNIG